MSFTTINNANIFLKNTTIGNNIPYFGNSGYDANGRTLWYLDGIRDSELCTKTPYGSTFYNSIASLYIPSFLGDVITSPTPAVSGFLPTHVINNNNEIYPAWRLAYDNVNFASPSISGNTGDRFEAMYLDYTTTVVSTPTGTAAAITGVTFAMTILKGGSASDGGAGNFQAKQIYYRKIGNVVRE
jgi:hypothetical protein